MLKRVGSFTLLLLFMLAAMTAAGQTGLLQARGQDSQSDESAAADCRELLRPFATVNFFSSNFSNFSNLNKSATEFLIDLNTRLTPSGKTDDEERAKHSQKGSTLAAGLALTFTGLGIMGVTGVVYLGQIALQYTCATLNTCNTLGGGSSNYFSAGGIDNNVYLIAVSVGGIVTLVGLILAVGSAQ